jgi:hypothetical protein
MRSILTLGLAHSSTFIDRRQVVIVRIIYILTAPKFLILQVFYPYNRCCGHAVDTLANFARCLRLILRDVVVVPVVYPYGRRSQGMELELGA